MKYDTWTPVPMFCANCGHLNYGYRNENGIIKYECKNCKAVSVRKQKGRRHDTIDLYAPAGQCPLMKQGEGIRRTDKGSESKQPIQEAVFCEKEMDECF